MLLLVSSSLPSVWHPRGAGPRAARTPDCPRGVYRPRRHDRVRKARVLVATSIALHGDYVICVDVGTSGVKASVVSITGEVAVSSAAPIAAYRDGMATGVGPLTGASEQKVSSWIAAFDSAVASLAQQCPNDARFHAIGLTGHMQDLIIVGANGVVPEETAIMYSDVRATREACELNAALHRSDITPSQLAPKLLWVERNWTHAAKQAEAVLFGAHDYFAYFLSDGAARITDGVTASTTGLLSTQNPSEFDRELVSEAVHESCWSRNVLDLLPVVSSRAKVVGRVEKHAQHSLPKSGAFLAGLPIVHALGDAGATVIGAGSEMPHVYVGTSGWIGTVIHNNASSAAQRAGTHSQSVGVFRMPLGATRSDRNGYAQIQTAILASTLLAGGCLQWVADLLFAGDISAACEHASASRNLERVRFLPHLKGERCPFEDPAARGAFLGLSSASTRGDLVRAVLEGVALNLCAAREQLEFSINVQEELRGAASTMRLVGGGGRSALWCQLLSDALGVTLLVPHDPQAVTALGCAQLTWEALGSFSGKDVEQHPERVNKFRPRAEFTELYERELETHKRLIVAVRGALA